MQAINLKVHYNNKNIIIGKGVESEDKIMIQLVKRFPQVANLRSHMRFQYQDDAISLKQAYDKAIKAQKKSVKVKVIVDYEQNADMTMNIQLLEQDFQQENDLNQSILSKQSNEKLTKIVRKSSFASAKSQKSNKSKKSVKAEEKPNPNQNQTKSNQSQISNLSKGTDKSKSIQIKKSSVSNVSSKKSVEKKEDISKLSRSRSRSCSPQRIQPQTKNKSLQKTQSIKKASVNERKNSAKIQIVQSNLSLQDSQKSFSMNQTSKIEQDIVFQQQVKLQQYECFLCSSFKNSTQVFECQMCNDKKFINQSHPAVVLMNKLVQRRTESLQQKLQSIEQKYNLLMIDLVEKSRLQKSSLLKKAPPKVLYSFKAQIIQIEHKQQVQTGKSVIPKFQIINYGPQDWPQNVYVLQKDNGEIKQIKSLKSGQRIVIELQPIQCVDNQAKEIGKNYQLVYYNEKDDMIPFARTFGMFFKVKKAQKAAINKPKEYSSIFDMEFAEENKSSKKLMEMMIDSKKKKLKCNNKSTTAILAHLKNLGITQSNIKDFGQDAIEDIIRTI